ncbi:MAG TPA: hypothetical protein VHT49_06620 [Acidimicrobiales bacterium]|jgi:hypothetical protein|nr:hypothetical protein [Acidimicrobiales bacterium]
MNDEDHNQTYQRDPATTRSAIERAQRDWGTRLFDPGDTHEKGELSLCVGEAA